MPELYITAFNTYGEKSYSVVEYEIANTEEGVRQGCPLAATFFNLGLVPLTEELSMLNNGSLIFYIDDGYYLGNPSQVAEFWNKLKLLGPSYGYHPNEKSILYGSTLNDDDGEWKNMGLIVTNAGLEVLGTPVVSKQYVETSTRNQYKSISEMVNRLNILSKIHPQAAFCLMSKSTQLKALHLCRTVKNAGSQAEQYDAAVKVLLNSLVVCDLSKDKLIKAALPIKEGGLGLSCISKDYSDEQYENSKTLTFNGVQSILLGEDLNDPQRNNDIRKRIQLAKKEKYKLIRNNITSNVSKEVLRRWEEKCFPGAGSWLHSIPVKSKPLTRIPKQEFSGALPLCLNITSQDLPTICLAGECNVLFTADHADHCAKGRNVIRRHDDIGTKSKAKGRNNTKASTAKFIEEEVIAALNEGSIKKSISVH